MDVFSLNPLMEKRTWRHCHNKTASFILHSPFFFFLKVNKTCVFAFSFFHQYGRNFRGLNFFDKHANDTNEGSNTVNLMPRNSKNTVRASICNFFWDFRHLTVWYTSNHHYNFLKFCWGQNFFSLVQMTQMKV